MVFKWKSFLNNPLQVLVALLNTYSLFFRKCCFPHCKIFITDSKLQTCIQYISVFIATLSGSLCFSMNEFIHLHLWLSMLFLRFGIGLYYSVFHAYEDSSAQIITFKALQLCLTVSHLVTFLKTQVILL